MNFYLRDTWRVAQDLLGYKLVRIITKNNRTIKVSGIIVETEAYGFENDHASHAFKGMTKRNQIMFGPVGRSYIYFIYGNHFCFNVTARSPKDMAGAVLIRAIEPLDGIQYMMQNRKACDQLTSLTNGPGKIAKALSINLQHSNYDLTNINSEIYIEQGIKPNLILATKRIGITKSIDAYWRFLIGFKKEDIIYINEFVSKKKENNNIKICKKL